MSRQKKGGSWDFWRLWAVAVEADEPDGALGAPSLNWTKLPLPSKSA